jgi:trans-aconitate methyltransferase
MPTVTTRSTEPDLAASNLFYRRPDLYDQVQADPDHTVARQVELLVTQHMPQARTLLDFGCGTGRDLEYLAGRFGCVGVDVQPGMVAYANRVRPHLNVRTGDMRTFRLGRSVDVVTCLGNSLAYVHGPDDVAAVFATFAAHSRTGTLLVLVTQTEPIQVEPKTHRVDTADMHGNVTIVYDWDEKQQINTMRRVWRLDDGTTTEDYIQRRVMTVEEIRIWLTAAGFCLAVESVAQNLYIIARYAEPAINGP